MKNGIEIAGHVHGQVSSILTGEVVQRFSDKNRIVSRGLSSVLFGMMPGGYQVSGSANKFKLASGTQPFLQQFRIGTLATTVSESDSSVGGNTHSENLAASNFILRTGENIASSEIAADGFRVAVTVAAGDGNASSGDRTYTEAGLFWNTSPEYMFSRILLNSGMGITKNPTLTITLNWDITVSYSG